MRLAVIAFAAALVPIAPLHAESAPRLEVAAAAFATGDAAPRRAQPRRSLRAAIVYPAGPADPRDVAAAWAQASARPLLEERLPAARAARAVALGSGGLIAYRTR